MAHDSSLCRAYHKITKVPKRGNSIASSVWIKNTETQVHVTGNKQSKGSSNGKCNPRLTWATPFPKSHRMVWLARGLMVLVSGGRSETQELTSHQSTEPFTLLLF